MNLWSGRRTKSDRRRIPGRGIKLAALLVSAGLSFLPAVWAQSPATPPAPAPATAVPAPAAAPANPGLDVTVVGPKVIVAEPDKPEAEAPHTIAGPAKPTVASPPAKGTAANTAKAPSGGVSATPTTDPGSRYVLGPNDVVQIQVYGDRTLTAIYPIGPDGMMSMPLINEFKASGLTLMALKEVISKKLEDFINDPEVSVGLARSNSKKYTLTGGLMRTGPIPLVQETTALDALSAAGFKDFSNKKKIVIIRDGKRIPFNYNEVIKGKNMQQNITLQDGDIIYVPE